MAFSRPASRLPRRRRAAVAAFATTPALANRQGMARTSSQGDRAAGAGGPADLVGRYVASATGRTVQAVVLHREPHGRRWHYRHRRGGESRAGRLHAAGGGVAAHQRGNPEPQQALPVDARFHRRVRYPFPPMRFWWCIRQVPAKNVKDLIALAKAKPGALTYASSGPGSNKHLGGELFKLMTGTDILHVAYKGSTGARNDIIGGHVNMMFDEVPSVAPNVLAGQVRALGVTGKQSAPAGCRTSRRFRKRACRATSTQVGSASMVPVGTPKPIVDLLNAEMRAMVARPDVKATWEKLGTETMSMTPAESRSLPACRNRQVDEGGKGREHQTRVNAGKAYAICHRHVRRLFIAGTDASPLLRSRPLPPLPNRRRNGLIGRSGCWSRSAPAGRPTRCRATCRTALRNSPTDSR